MFSTYYIEYILLKQRFLQKTLFPIQTVQILHNNENTSYLYKIH